MSVVLDTGVLVAAANPQDRNADRAVGILTEVAEGVHGAAFVTDYVVDEALTLAWVRTRRSDIVLHLADWLLARDEARRPGRLLFVGESSFDDAARLHGRHHARLSFTDCTSLAVMAEHRIEKIATFERGFDGLAEVLR